ncbi:MAG: sulfur carrier protein ThiS adenylyltransferase ThiF [Bacteroidetes bacterium]|nr:sulfur carrier protein ThiS adenylyltransferase ThiF [Bacteroidota bacterium]
MLFNEIKKILSGKTVGIAGCGGLGSNAAVALARVGVGTLIIADFDRVDETNLNRQYYFHDQMGQFKASALKNNIEKINPSILVHSHIITLDEQNVSKLFAGCDVIVEAFDLAEMKEMLIETVQSEMPNIPLVSGVGMSGWGQNESIKTIRYDNLFIVGDGEIEASKETPPLAPRVGVVSNMMANVVLELLLGEMANETKPQQ